MGKWEVGEVGPLLTLKVYTKNVVRKPEAKRPIGRLSLRWKDNIKINIYD
jgi:hypothetical protein